MLKIKRTGLESEYEVVGHNWHPKNGKIYIAKSLEDDGLWFFNYAGTAHKTLSEAKAFAFETLEADGLVA